MTERFSVRVTKDHLVFCSGHFITYDGRDCERLHGHNYRVAVELESVLDPNHYVFDFIALKDRTREIIDRLDHRMLVATRNPLLAVESDDRRVRIAFRDKEWIFPREDCVLLEMENTTAELLARWIGQQLRLALHEKHRFVPDVMRVTVDESFGQSATCEWRK